MAAFAKVQQELANPWMLAVYIVAMIAICWHFSYGVWLFAAKWGITPGTRARKRFGYVCVALGLGLAVMGLEHLGLCWNDSFQLLAFPVLPAAMREARKVEGLRLPFPSAFPILSGKPPELGQSYLVGMLFQPKLPRPLPELPRKTLRVRLNWNPRMASTAWWATTTSPCARFLRQSLAMGFGEPGRLSDTDLK